MKGKKQMTKVDAFQKFDDINMRRMQLVYLHDNGIPTDEIAKWTQYAVSTVRSYISKFSDLLEEARKIFRKITIKAKTELLKGREQVYLFKFYHNLDELICSKVGTTTRLPEQRLKEELKYYQDHGIDVDRGEICAVINCGELPAEGAESQLRAAFIKKYPTAFCKNDRFFNVNISVQSFNKIVKEYLA